MKKIEITVALSEAEKVKNAFEQMEIVSNSAEFWVEGQKSCYYSVLVPDEISDRVVGAISETIDLRIKENTTSVIFV